ncbi:MAG: hypothetical protein EPN75_08720 [Beijerinckiaceae bacterium]|nr:MAG: hypothetical protein EPN75_08720 [Beijerinckiaceae bacterium]
MTFIKAMSVKRYGRRPFSLSTVILLASLISALGYVHAYAQGEICQTEGQVRSMQGSTPASIIFSNGTDLDLVVYWLDYNGKRVFYKSLRPGEAYTQKTFLTHPWLIAGSTGACKLIVVSQQLVQNIALLPGALQPPMMPMTSNGDPTEAARNCVQAHFNTDLNRFSACWVMQMASEPQRRIGNCIITNNNWDSAGFCMAGKYLSPTEEAVARCAQHAGNQTQMIIACASVFSKVNPEILRLAGCVASNPTNSWGAAMCVGGAHLTPEQQVFAECAFQTGLQPYAFAVCATNQLTINEFQKCLTIGVGGNGCFGKNNTIVKLVHDAWKGISGGPNSVLNRPGQLFGGPRSIFHDPAQVWGGPNSMFRNPAQVWGGPNSVIRNPDQLLGGKNSFFHKQLGLH